MIIPNQEKYKVKGLLYMLTLLVGLFFFYFSWSFYFNAGFFGIQKNNRCQCVAER